MALFNIPFRDSTWDFTEKLWKIKADSLSIGDQVSFNVNNTLFGIHLDPLKGKINKFYNWHTVEVITENGGKWSVPVSEIN